MNARRGSAILFLFSFSHYILNDVATSNCKAMISMIKATCFFLQYGDENICEVYRVLIGAACRRCDVVNHHPSTTSYGAYSTVDCSVRVLNILCCHISTSWSTCAVPNMAVFVPAVYVAQVLYILNDCETVPVSPVVTGIFFYTFHLPCIYVVRSFRLRS